jgi:hypothetical protein
LRAEGSGRNGIWLKASPKRAKRAEKRPKGAC